MSNHFAQFRQKLSKKTEFSKGSGKQSPQDSAIKQEKKKKVSHKKNPCVHDLSLQSLSSLIKEKLKKKKELKKERVLLLEKLLIVLNQLKDQCKKLLHFFQIKDFFLN